MNILIHLKGYRDIWLKSYQGERPQFTRNISEALTFKGQAVAQNCLDHIKSLTGLDAVACCDDCSVLESKPIDIVGPSQLIQHQSIPATKWRIAAGPLSFFEYFDGTPLSA